MIFSWFLKILASTDPTEKSTPRNVVSGKLINKFHLNVDSQILITKVFEVFMGKLQV